MTRLSSESPRSAGGTTTPRGSLMLQGDAVFTALAMCGAAWIVARSLATAPAARARSLHVEPEADTRRGLFESIR